MRLKLKTKHILWKIDKNHMWVLNLPQKHQKIQFRAKTLRMNVECIRNEFDFRYFTSKTIAQIDPYFCFEYL